ncbi:hypothetical protein [Lentibacillus amyloliquefaciens]|uniref:hypothetical protein n=1 Tax=Lentibacillus amyloliquefaciens TaxID=1472767 RepID=UPI0014706F68|nr:hypothetical protein [Lentibacillus amyloliquefaciens]
MTGFFNSSIHGRNSGIGVDDKTNNDLVLKKCGCIGFKLIFYSFIFIIAIGLILASIAGYNDMSEQ